MELRTRNPSSDLAHCEWPVLRAIADHSPALSAVVGPSGVIRHASERAARTLLGLSSADAANRQTRDFFPERLCDAEDALCRRLIRQGRGVREVSMLRGVYTVTSIVPLHVPGEGDVVLSQTIPGNPALAGSASPFRLDGHDDPELVQCPVADLGALSSLTRRELLITRALAQGLGFEELAEGLDTPVMSVATTVSRIGRKLGWGDLRGVRTHAYASGLHLFEDAYFGLVILAAAEPEA